ncbi:beta-1,6-N-acetylglucosaminyltransferase [Polaribacter sp. IC073]|nr:beta-1,6-N-acetylglucosaminyltransferase [Polaribacter sp. IC073]
MKVNFILQNIYRVIKTYIITVHNNPNHLKRLINRLNDNKSKFYIHVDLKSDIKSFKDIIDLSNVEFIKERVNCIWGDFSQVMATINLLRYAILNKNHNSKIIFLSGQDYSIKSLYDIDKYLIENKKNEFISFDNDPFEKSFVYKQRVHQYKINKSDKRLDFVFLNPILSSDFNNLKLFIKLILKRKIKIKETFGFLKIKRKLIFKKQYKGSNWFALNYSTVNSILDFIEKNKV